MYDINALWIFVGALAVVYLVPGADMILILQTSALYGRAHALAVVVGLGMARAMHVFLAAIGLAALLKTAPWAFEIVRIIGAAYLIWIGIAILRSPSFSPLPGSAGRAESRRPLSASLSRGLLTNLLNPKALLFCSVLLPQFIRPELGSIPMQFVLLGIILITVGAAFDLLYAGVGTALGTWLARRPLVQLSQKWLFGLILIGFGLRLATSQRPL